MGAIMVFGIIGLGLLAPIGYPAMIAYVLIENLFDRISETFKNIGFGD